ncbi:helix-turn-helix domain-containing protein [Cohnella suwonensis]|uniref:Helix-turn-helix domain-containing protein n=1 Tax=Cohnella suwonensis TaxID=696072 RepID=A0ABW0LY12_9BACL
MRKSSISYIAKDKVKLDSDYPISVTETSGVAPQYQRLHWHDVLEINLIKKGTGYYAINGQTIEFSQGDILLIDCNDLHRAYEREGLVILVISFSPAWFLADMRYDPTLLAPFTEMGVHYENLIPRACPRMDELRSILIKIQRENDRKAFSHISVIRSHLLRFLAYVGRECRRDIPGRNVRTAVASPKQMAKIRDVLNLMEQHYAEEWDLKSLSELAFLSPARFSAQFKQTMGVSPMDYLIQIRMSNAVRLLEDSDRKIVDVAYECGFHNLSNFNRLFKSNFGFSPSRVRDRARSGKR